MSTDSTALLLSTKTKQKNQCNEASRPLKRAQRYLNIKYGEVSLQFEFATLPPKPQPSALSHTKYGEVSLQIEFATLPPKPQPLYEMKMKR